MVGCCRQALRSAALALALTGCGGETPAPAPGGSQRPLPGDPARGALTYQRYCAVCHGKAAEGVPDWQIPGPDGRYLPPPLNGSGHAWHHPTAVLMDLIQNGTQASGGNMPPWKAVLGEKETLEIIAWLQTLWPDPLYQAWQRLEHEASGR